MIANLHNCNKSYVLEIIFVVFYKRKTPFIRAYTFEELISLLDVCLMFNKYSEYYIFNDLTSR